MIVDASLEFVNRHNAEPFFLYLPFLIPHAGLEVPEDSLREFAGKFPEQPWSSERSSYAPVSQPRAALAGMITRMDRDVGRLLQLLTELGIDGRTIVLFTSDNGAHREGGHNPDFFDSTGGLRGIKRDLYEGGIRVQLIVRWPGRIKAGKTSDEVWAHWDLLPTLAELAGASTPREIDGISFAPALLGRRQKRHEYLYWEFFERGFQQAVRLGDWKGVKPAHDKPIELYNLARDRGEQEDVASKNAKVTARIEAIMKSARTQSALWWRTPWEAKP
jgi:arylsulfatase A